MKITDRLLKKYQACEQGYTWVTENKLVDLPASDFIKGLIDGKKYAWAYWLLRRIMTLKQLTLLAIYTVKQYQKLFKEKYPKDTDTPPVMKAVIKLLENPTKENLSKLQELRSNYRADRADIAYRADRADIAYRADREPIVINCLKYAMKLLKE